jgi:hypothetical protein
VLGKVAFLKLILYIIIEHFFKKKIYLYNIYKMSLRKLYQDNLKSDADVKCNDLDVAGTLTADGTIQADDFVANNSIRINAEQVYGQEGLFHVTNWSGAIAATAGNISIIREGPMVTLEFPSVTAANVGASTIVSDTPLPADLRPANSANFYMVAVEDNTFVTLGQCKIDETTGVITFGVGAGGANYMASGSSGFFSFTCRYET